MTTEPHSVRIDNLQEFVILTPNGTITIYSEPANPGTCGPALTIDVKDVPDSDGSEFGLTDIVFNVDGEEVARAF